ncbi:beta-ketoacyl synthase N-terminal-like domain-containing protein [Colwelliaceae bacterium MEBiC 14330]
MNENKENRALLESALTKIRTLKKELAIQKNSVSDEPIAIVGIGCRLPGSANNVEQFWQNLLNGKDSVVPLNNQRWQHQQYFDEHKPKKGKTYSPRAGLIDQVLDFDADFFNITPREAEWMDPQQRQLLEVSWEALENAGMAADKIRGANAGVFVGVMNKDHSDLLVQQLEAEQLLPHMNTGNHESVHSGRLSYFFDFKGPCLTLNTACSSSLMTVHLASQSLRANECDFAIAGGCNVLLSPLSSIAQSQATMHSKSGYCKTFDASADGYVRAEGCGVVVLKKLSDAKRDNDRIYSVIKGSAVNQDGLSQGISAPNGASQERVMRAALKQAKLAANEVDFVEAHGTGTKLGDPIEFRALENVYGKVQRRNPLYIGALKSSIGHSESAAGVAGLIKLAKVLETGTIPKNLHFNTINPDITLSTDSITLCNKQEVLSKEKKRIGAVSSFGFSGSNAHIILESYENQQLDDLASTPDNHLLRISGKNSAALTANIKNAISFLQSSSDKDLADICYTYNTGRCAFSHSTLVTGQNTAQLIQALQKVTPIPPINRKQVNNAFLVGAFNECDFKVFKSLYDSFPVVKTAFDKISKAIYIKINSDLDFASFDIFEPSLNHYAQLACLYAVNTLWRSLNLLPSQVICADGLEYVGKLLQQNLPLEKWLDIDSINYDKSSSLAFVFSNANDLPKTINSHEICNELRTNDIKRLINIGSVTAPLASSFTGEKLYQLNLFNNKAKSVSQVIAEDYCQLYHDGMYIDLLSWQAQKTTKKTTVPSYAFQRETYWLDEINTSALGQNAVVKKSTEPETVSSNSETFHSTPKEYILRQIAEITKIPLNKVNTNGHLVGELGFDSIMVVDLRERLNKKYPDISEIPFNVLYEGSVVELIAYINAHLDSIKDKSANVNSHQDNKENELIEMLALIQQWESEMPSSKVLRLNKKWVHKYHDNNVLLGQTRKLGKEHWYVAQVYQDNQHSFFYEHPQDHVPGLYLIEAARQFGLVCAHQFFNVPLEMPFVLDDMQIKFDHFAEKDSPLYLLNEYTDSFFVEGVMHRMQSRCYIVQNQQVLGVITGRGLIMERQKYTNKRLEHV